MTIKTYFHRMGHYVCQNCNDRTFLHKGGLLMHLHAHRVVGDDIGDQETVLRLELEAMWNQAMKEGRA